MVSLGTQVGGRLEYRRAKVLYVKAGGRPRYAGRRKARIQAGSRTTVYVKAGGRPRYAGRCKA